MLWRVNHVKIYTHFLSLFNFNDVSHYHFYTLDVLIHCWIQYTIGLCFYHEHMSKISSTIVSNFRMMLISDISNFGYRPVKMLPGNMSVTPLISELLQTINMSSVLTFLFVKRCTFTATNLMNSQLALTFLAFYFSVYRITDMAASCKRFFSKSVRVLG